MKIKQLEWSEDKGEKTFYTYVFGFRYCIKITFNDKWYKLYSLYVGKFHEQSRLNTNLNIEDLKQIAQQHFENEIKQYLED